MVEMMRAECGGSGDGRRRSGATYGETEWVELVGEKLEAEIKVEGRISGRGV
jgi:hypothetical protein